uniref:Amidohydrolase n=1 Tax=Desulfomonile tiedjei TaxID=2358 RepID=A0A7C4ES36_9BACT
MIIDFHIHLFPRKVREHRGEYCAEDRGFAAIYSSPKARIASDAEIIKYLDDAAIDKGVVFGFPWGEPDLVKRNNDEIWDFAQRYPGRIIPFAVLSSADMASAGEEAERTLGNGFAGLGELAFYDLGWTASLAAGMQPVLDAVAAHGKPVLLHVNEPVGHQYPGKIHIDFASLIAMIEANPSVTFVLAHFGGGVFIYDLMPEIRAAFERTYLDTAASPYLYDPRIFQIARDIMGEDKILFGSDYPLLPLPRYLQQLEKADITSAARAAILGGNAEKLLHISGS